MKICITSQGMDAASEVDPRFGRAKVFALYDTEDNSVVFEENEAASGTGGVGVRVGQMMVKKGVKTILTGKVGMNAAEVLQAGDITVIDGVTGSVEDVYKKFVAGELG